MKLLCISLLLFCASAAMAVDNVLMNAYAVCLNHSNMAPKIPEDNYTYDKGFEKCHRIVSSVSKKQQEENAPWEERERKKDLNVVNKALSELGR